MPPKQPGGDGDLFVIVASDGVWEFIPSQEAAEMVYAQGEHASKACEDLVQEAAARWRQVEGNYRGALSLGGGGGVRSASAVGEARWPPWEER